MGARTGKELRTVGGFFFLMEVGAASEHGFKQVTVVSRCDLRLGVDNVERIAGTVGTLMINVWTRCGMITADFFPLVYGLRPEKLLFTSL